MTVYFIRHNWDGPQWTQVISTLFQANRVGVHFDEVQPPADPFDPNQYSEKAGRTAIRYLSQCSDEQALVVGAYRNHDRILIGLSEVNSKQALSINGIQIKSLQLTNVRTITMDEFPLPFLIAPPFSTMVQWDKGTLAVNSFYFNQNPELAVDLLSPWHLEILAEKWLRRRGLLTRKLYKTGKSMKDMDIVGISPHGRYVVAQIKFSCKDEVISAFFERVQQLHNTFGYFFTKDSVMQHERLILLTNVFDEFQNEQSYLRGLIFGRL
jgi:hypothetical protein